MAMKFPIKIDQSKIFVSVMNAKTTDSDYDLPMAPIPCVNLMDGRQIGPGWGDLTYIATQLGWL